MPSYTDWQLDQLGCECLIHRYHVAHICACGEVISHSQGDFDSHKNHGGMIDFDPKNYRHGASVESTFDYLSAHGLLPYADPDFASVYEALANKLDWWNNLQERSTQE